MPGLQFRFFVFVIVCGTLLIFSCTGTDYPTPAYPKIAARSHSEEANLTQIYQGNNCRYALSVFFKLKKNREKVNLVFYIYQESVHIQ